MFLICLSDVGEHSKFKQPNYPLTVTYVLTIILLGASRNSSESLVTSLHLGFLSILVILVFLKFFMGKRKKKKTTHAHCNLCLIPLMLLNIPSGSVDVTHVPKSKENELLFSGPFVIRFYYHRDSQTPNGKLEPLCPDPHLLLWFHNYELQNLSQLCPQGKPLKYNYDSLLPNNQRDSSGAFIFLPLSPPHLPPCLSSSSLSTFSKFFMQSCENFKNTLELNN